MLHPQLTHPRVHSSYSHPHIEIEHRNVTPTAHPPEDALLILTPTHRDRTQKCYTHSSPTPTQGRTPQTHSQICRQNTGMLHLQLTHHSRAHSSDLFLDLCEIVSGATLRNRFHMTHWDDNFLKSLAQIDIHSHRKFKYELAIHVQHVLLITGIK